MQSVSTLKKKKKKKKKKKEKRFILCGFAPQKLHSLILQFMLALPIYRTLCNLYMLCNLRMYALHSIHASNIPVDP